MNLNLDFEKILFLDIETVPEVENFEELSKIKKELFDAKTQYQRKDEITAEDFYQRAGIWAEFGKIVCISVGYFTNFKSDSRNFRVTSFYGEEKKVLENFAALVLKHFDKPNHLLCAHNGKEFDFPYISRRMIINQIKLPNSLNLFGKKPWEIQHLDTMDLWKFGDYKHFTSLKLLTEILQIPSPKDDISGSDVSQVFYKENNLERIVIYCEKDTIAVAQLLLRFNNEPLLQEDQIIKI
ncbi:3'-5' exonuclease [Lutibacter sp.]|uniref:3'-5' exonuclease n=1 Tax=Lutibacter sp. TaxID=1925666 RepID=UPI002735568A|nr:3'-5' exonuclease [Lutibacter sp.]MDP3313845.1 3'-5' exonuclease [Lutibacter sp.]